MFSAAARNRVAIELQKIKVRANKAKSLAKNRVMALPKIPRVILSLNYVNPITLNFPKGLLVYEITNKVTGRKNYYDKDTFRKLITQFTTDYNLMMMNPKEPIPGARNPMTRGPIYPRNIRRVTVAVKKKTPTRNNAARKIQNAVRKHQAAKKTTRNNAAAHKPRNNAAATKKKKSR